MVPSGVGISHEASQVLLVFGRVICGFGQGFCALLNRVTIVRITPPENRVQQGVRYQFFTMLGMGLGPACAALARLGTASLPYAQIIGIQHVGIVGTGTQLISLFCIFMLLPNISKCADQLAMQDGGGDRVTAEDPPPDPDSWQKKRLVLTTLVLLSVRSFIAAGLESTTSLALELRYKWPKFYVGTTVSGSYLLTIPLVLAFSYVKDASTPATLAIVLLLVQWLATFLLYPFSFFDSGWCLFASDCFVFPLMALGDGMFIGRMDMLKFPEGTLFETNTRILIQGVVTNGVARLLGPITARLVYSEGGLLGYAIQQTVCLAACFGLFLTIYKTFAQGESTIKVKKKAIPKATEPWSWPVKKRF
jgi:hypothetical protein